MIYYTDFYIPSIKKTFLIAKNEKGVCSLSFDNNERLRICCGYDRIIHDVVQIADDPN